MHKLCKKEFLAVLAHQDVTHRLAMNVERDSDFDAGKFESKLTPKHVEELVEKNTVCKERRIDRQHELNNMVVQMQL